MSQTSAARVGRPAGRLTSRALPGAPRLRAVGAPRQARSRAGVAIGCLMLLVAGLVALLMVNISLSHGSYEMYELQQRQVKLAEQRQALSEEIAASQSPRRLERQARSLGMVPAPQVAFLHLSDGSESGAALAADSVRPPTVGDRP